jgi:hypothetical protein
LEEDSPYMTASAACCASCKATICAIENACLVADLEDVWCQCARYEDMEAWLLVMAQGAPDLNMGDCEEEVVTCRVSKKESGTKGSS